MSNDIVDRLRGHYSMGPHLPNGKPEFGIRQFETTPINREAADYIEMLRARLELADKTMEENFQGMTKLYDALVLDFLELKKQIEELKFARDKWRERFLGCREKVREFRESSHEI